MHKSAHSLTPEYHAELFFGSSGRLARGTRTDPTNDQASSVRLLVRLHLHEKYLMHRSQSTWDLTVQSSQHQPEALHSTHRRSEHPTPAAVGALMIFGGLLGTYAKARVCCCELSSAFCNDGATTDLKIELRDPKGMPFVATPRMWVRCSG